MKAASPEIGLCEPSPQAAAYRRELAVDDAAALEPELDRTVDEDVAQAMASPGRGVLVTRHGHNRFSLALSDAVPPGTTHELDLQ